MNCRNYFLLVIFVLCSAWSVAQTPDRLPLKLRVATYNIGHFNQGSLGGFSGLKGHAQAELLHWKRWVGTQNFDILAVQEWNTYFDKDSVYQADKEILAPFYQNRYWGKANRWVYNGIATNYSLSNVRQVDLDGDYYAIIGDIQVGEKLIAVISTHVPWQKEWHDRSLEKLIGELKKYEYFICMGDINAKDENQLKFVEAGFNMANGGHLGWFSTSASALTKTGRTGEPNTNIDNIITSSNIKIFNVSAPKTGLNDLDHLPVIADLVITW